MVHIIFNNNKATEKEMGEKRAHAVPVPKSYKAAAKILEQYCDKKGSLRTILYQETRATPQRLFAITSRVIDQYSLIEKALDSVKLFEHQPQFNKHLAFILTSEVMVKNGPLPGDYKPALIINIYEKELRKYLISAGFDSQKEEKEYLPRYARINTLLTTEEDVHSKLKLTGMKLVTYDTSMTSYDEYLEMVKNLDTDYYMKDYHIPNLLVFPYKVKFWKSELSGDSHIMLQDKASCIPAFVSGVKPGDFAIDACAAPGNKTNHLANLMENKGRLVAVDRDPNRLETMSRLLKDADVTCAELVNEDSRYLNFRTYSKEASVILVDPSCSSSGTLVHNDVVSQERLVALASNQLKILSHALHFNTKTVVYSTCSINEEENEQVVEKALKKFKLFELEDLRPSLPGWKHFGFPNYPSGHMCIRTVPSVDKCKGFFVAKFVRKSKGAKKKLEKGHGKKLVLKGKKTRSLKKNTLTSVLNGGAKSQFEEEEVATVTKGRRKRRKSKNSLKPELNEETKLQAEEKGVAIVRKPRRKKRSMCRRSRNKNLKLKPGSEEKTTSQTKENVVSTVAKIKRKVEEVFLPKKKKRLENVLQEKSKAETNQPKVKQRKRSAEIETAEPISEGKSTSKKRRKLKQII